LRNHHNRLAAALKGRVADARAKLEGLTGRRVLREPFDRLHDLARQLDLLGDRAVRAVRNRLSNAQQRAAALAGQLESLSPLGVLARGYSLTTRLSDGRLIEDAAKLSPGERIKSRFARGTSISRVEEIADEPHEMRGD
jgi:exodeoxyribonuclease VII large subunit